MGVGCFVSLHPYISLIQNVLRPLGVECRVFLSSLGSAKYASPVYNDEMTENLFFAPAVSRIVASYIYETGYGLRSRDNFLKKSEKEGCEDYEFQNLLTSIETNVFGLQWIILNLLHNKQVYGYASLILCLIYLLISA